MNRFITVLFCITSSVITALSPCNPDSPNIAYSECGSVVVSRDGGACVCCKAAGFSSCGCENSQCETECAQVNTDCLGMRSVPFVCASALSANSPIKPFCPDPFGGGGGTLCENIWYCTPAVAPTSNSTNMASTTFNAIRENSSLHNSIEDFTEAEDPSNTLPSGSPLFFGKGKEPNVIWGKGIYQNIKEGRVRVNSWGAFVGYDSLYQESLIGVVAGFFRSKSNNTFLGGGSVDFASLTIHGMVEMPHSTYFQWGLLGSFNWNEIDRKEESDVIKSSFLSYTLSPALSVGCDWKLGGWGVLEPYVSTDFIFDFEPSYEEEMAVLPRKYNSHESGIFRLESGLNLYEYWKTERTLFLFREKVGYVRRQVMFGATSSFGLDALEGDIVEADSGLYSQNLLTYSGQFFVRFYQGIFFSLHYRGEQGWSPQRFVLNEGRARIGYYF